MKINYEDGETKFNLNLKSEKNLQWKYKIQIPLKFKSWNKIFTMKIKKSNSIQFEILKRILQW